MSKNEVTVYNHDDIPEPTYDGFYRNIDAKFINYIDKRVRMTWENKEFIKYMKRFMDISKCSFYKDYNMENGFTIELHHAPLTLYDYSETVTNKHFELSDKKDKCVLPHLIVNEVNLLHAEFLVGLVPLNPTAHELVHSDKLDIHPRMVVGRFAKFAQEYDEYLSDTVKEKLLQFNIKGATDPDQVPSIIKYTPTIITNSKFKSLGDLKLEEFIIEQQTAKFLELQNG